MATEFFNTGDTNFTAQIAAVKAQNPDAVQIISFDQAKTIMPAMKDAGFDMSKLYLVDGNTSQYRTQFKDGTLTGAKGTNPGPLLNDDFQKRLVDNWAAENKGDVLKEFTYAAESYDAVVLLALAALKAKSVDGKAIAAQLQSVSGGADNGKKATDFKSAARDPQRRLGGRLRRPVRRNQVRQGRRPDRGDDRYLPVRREEHVQAHQQVATARTEGPDQIWSGPSPCPGPAHAVSNAGLASSGGNP